MHASCPLVTSRAAFAALRCGAHQRDGNHARPGSRAVTLIHIKRIAAAPSQNDTAHTKPLRARVLVSSRTRNHLERIPNKPGT